MKTTRELIQKYLKRSEAKLISKAYHREIALSLSMMDLFVNKERPKDYTLRDCYSFVQFGEHKSISSRTKRTNTMKAFWRWAQEQGYVNKSPAKRVITEEPGLSDLVAVEISAQTVSALLPHLDDYSRSCLLVLWGCGIRAADLRHIKETDIDGSNMLLRIKRGRTIRHKAPIPDEEILYALYDLVHHTLKNGHSNRWKSQIDEANKKEKLPAFGPSEIRFAYIRRLFSEGHSPMSIMKWTGIKSWATLARYYEASGLREGRPWPTGITSFTEQRSSENEAVV